MSREAASAARCWRKQCRYTRQSAVIDSPALCSQDVVADSLCRGYRDASTQVVREGVSNRVDEKVACSGHLGVVGQPIDGVRNDCQLLRHCCRDAARNFVIRSSQLRSASG